MLEESCSLTQPVGRLKFGNVPAGSGASRSSCTSNFCNGLAGGEAACSSGVSVLRGRSRLCLRRADFNLPAMITSQAVGPAAWLPLCIHHREPLSKLLALNDRRLPPTQKGEPAAS